MAADGIAVSNRVDGLTERKLYRKITDNILNSTTYAARAMGMGEPFTGKTKDYTIKISRNNQGQFFTGLETLNASAANTRITLSYAHTGFAQPAVSIMLEAFANAGPEGTIDYDIANLEEAQAEAIQSLGISFYGTGSNNQPLGLEAIVDDGTNAATIGGQSRTTYTNLQASVLASGGTLTLAKMATQWDAASAAGLQGEEPNIGVTTKTVWSLIEQLLYPSVRADYASVGYDKLAIRGKDVVRPGELKGAAGFNAITYRGIPIIKDDACTSGVLYFLNEDYNMWLGRTTVPTKYSGVLEKISLGNMKTYEGVSAEQNIPSDAGFFFQKYQMLPTQAGQIARIYCIGQFATKQPRRNSKITGITGI